MCISTVRAAWYHSWWARKEAQYTSIPSTKLGFFGAHPVSALPKDGLTTIDEQNASSNATAHDQRTPIDCTFPCPRSRVSAAARIRLMFGLTVGRRTDGIPFRAGDADDRVEEIGRALACLIAPHECLALEQGSLIVSATASTCYHHV